MSADASKKAPDNPGNALSNDERWQVCYGEEVRKTRFSSIVRVAIAKAIGLPAHDERPDVSADDFKKVETLINGVEKVIDRALNELGDTSIFESGTKQEIDIEDVMNPMNAGIDGLVELVSQDQPAESIDEDAPVVTGIVCNVREAIHELRSRFNQGSLAEDAILTDMLEVDTLDVEQALTASLFVQGPTPGASETAPLTITFDVPTESDSNQEHLFSEFKKAHDRREADRLGAAQEAQLRMVGARERKEHPNHALLRDVPRIVLCEQDSISDRYTKHAGDLHISATKIVSTSVSNTCKDDRLRYERIMEAFKHSVLKNLREKSVASLSCPSMFVGLERRAYLKLLAELTDGSVELPDSLFAKFERNFKKELDSLNTIAEAENRLVPMGCATEKVVVTQMRERSLSWDKLSAKTKLFLQNEVLVNFSGWLQYFAESATNQDQRDFFVTLLDILDLEQIKVEGKCRSTKDLLHKLEKAHGVVIGEAVEKLGKPYVVTGKLQQRYQQAIDIAFSCAADSLTFFCSQFDGEEFQLQTGDCSFFSERMEKILHPSSADVSADEKSESAEKVPKHPLSKNIPAIVRCEPDIVLGLFKRCHDVFADKITKKAGDHLPKQSRGGNSERAEFEERWESIQWDVRPFIDAQLLTKTYIRQVNEVIGAATKRAFTTSNSIEAKVLRFFNDELDKIDTGDQQMLLPCNPSRRPLLLSSYSSDASLLSNRSIETHSNIWHHRLLHEPKSPLVDFLASCKNLVLKEQRDHESELVGELAQHGIALSDDFSSTEQLAACVDIMRRYTIEKARLFGGPYCKDGKLLPVNEEAIDIIFGCMLSSLHLESQNLHGDDFKVGSIEDSPTFQRVHRLLHPEQIKAGDASAPESTAAIIERAKEHPLLQHIPPFAVTSAINLAKPVIIRSGVFSESIQNACQHLSEKDKKAFNSDLMNALPSTPLICANPTDAMYVLIGKINYYAKKYNFSVDISDQERATFVTELTSDFSHFDLDYKSRILPVNKKETPVVIALGEHSTQISQGVCCLHVQTWIAKFGADIAGKIPSKTLITPLCVSLKQLFLHHIEPHADKVGREALNTEELIATLEFLYKNSEDFILSQNNSNFVSNGTILPECREVLDVIFACALESLHRLSQEIPEGKFEVQDIQNVSFFRKLGRLGKKPKPKERLHQLELEPELRMTPELLTLDFSKDFREVDGVKAALTEFFREQYKIVERCIDDDLDCSAVRRLQERFIQRCTLKIPTSSAILTLDSAVSTFLKKVRSVFASAAMDNRDGFEFSNKCLRPLEDSLRDSLVRECAKPSNVKLPSNSASQPLLINVSGSQVIDRATISNYIKTWYSFFLEQNPKVGEASDLISTNIRRLLESFFAKTDIGLDDPIESFGKVCEIFRMFTKELKLDGQRRQDRTSLCAAASALHSLYVLAQTVDGFECQEADLDNSELFREFKEALERKPKPNAPKAEAETTQLELHPMYRNLPACVVAGLPNNLGKDAEFTEQIVQFIVDEVAGYKISEAEVKRGPAQPSRKRNRSARDIVGRKPSVSQLITEADLGTLSFATPMHLIHMAEVVISRLRKTCKGSQALSLSVKVRNIITKNILGDTAIASKFTHFLKQYFMGKCTPCDTGHLPSNNQDASFVIAVAPNEPIDANRVTSALIHWYDIIIAEFLTESVSGDPSVKHLLPSASEDSAALFASDIRKMQEMQNLTISSGQDIIDFYTLIHENIMQKNSLFHSKVREGLQIVEATIAFSLHSLYLAAQHSEGFEFTEKQLYSFEPFRRFKEALDRKPKSTKSVAKNGSRRKSKRRRGRRGGIPAGQLQRKNPDVAQWSSQLWQHAIRRLTCAQGTQKVSELKVAAGNALEPVKEAFCNQAKQWRGKNDAAACCKRWREIVEDMPDSANGVALPVYSLRSFLLDAIDDFARTYGVPVDEPAQPFATVGPPIVGAEVDQESSESPVIEADSEATEEGGGTSATETSSTSSQTPSESKGAEVDEGGGAEEQQEAQAKQSGEVVPEMTGPELAGKIQAVFESVSSTARSLLAIRDDFNKLSIDRQAEVLSDMQQFANVAEAMVSSLSPSLNKTDGKDS